VRPVLTTLSESADMAGVLPTICQLPSPAFLARWSFPPLTVHMEHLFCLPERPLGGAPQGGSFGGAVSVPGA
jgi:hypothetical protein